MCVAIYYRCYCTATCFCRVPSAMLLSLLCRFVQGFFDEQGHAASLKAAVVCREYEALVAKQLQEQQRYDTHGTAVTTAVDEILHSSRRNSKSNVSVRISVRIATAADEFPPRLT